MSTLFDVALRAQLKRIVMASFLTLGFAAAVAAFSIGFTGALTRTLADPASAPRLRAAALERLDESLGYGGFLGTYRVFLTTSGREEAAELRRFAGDAEGSLSAFSRAAVSGADGDYASALRRLVAPFQRVAENGTAQTGTGQAPYEQVERNYAALKRTIVAAADEAVFARNDDLAGALLWSQTLSVAALMALAAVLFALAWYLRDRLIAPLSRLRLSLSAAAAGGSDSVWGLERPDEIGAVARAAERLRERAQPQIAARIPELHLDIMHRLGAGAARLEADLAKAAATSAEACRRIEEAGRAASEAAGVAQAPTARPTGRNNVIDAMGRFQAEARNLEPAAVLEDLAIGLDGLEKFARERRSMREDQLVTLTAAALQAVDRLNAVAYAMADTDHNVIRAAE